MYVVLLSMLIIGAAQAEDGIYILSKTKTLSNGGVSTSEIFLTSSQMLVKSTGMENSTLIFNSEQEIFTYIDSKRKEYYQFDKPTLMQLKQQIKMMAQMMKQFAANMPADQKAKLDKVLNPSSGASLTYQATNKTTKIGKWKTNGYEGLEAGKKVLSLDLATYDALGMDKEDFKVMEALMVFFQKNLQEVIAILPAGEAYTQLSLDENSPIIREGLPLKSMTYENGKPTIENVVESIKKQNFSDGQFDIPTGYTKQQINMKTIGK